MKKLLFLLTSVLALSASTSFARVGDYIGNAYHTDIVAYINNYAIPSYAVNGTSCIVAEDLRNFCFDVTWNNSTRSLIISRNNNTQPIGMNFSKTGIPSTKFADLLETDISVYAQGRRVTSYAINGYTMIPMEELNVFGNCNWVESERALKLWIDGIHIRSTKQNVAAPTSILELANAGGSLTPKYNRNDLYGNFYPVAYANHYASPKIILNQKYTRFTTTAFIEQISSPRGGYLKFYADDKLIYEAFMKNTNQPLYIDLDVTGCNVLKIYAPNGAIDSDILLYSPEVK